MSTIQKTVTISLAYLTLLAASHAEPIKVACVGDSITQGARIKNPAQNAFPQQLNRMLGDDYEVKNFGRSGTTLLKKGNRPYTRQKEYCDSLAFNPDIVIIKLGTNDSKPGNWPEHKADFAQDMVALIKSYQALPSKPRVLLCKPVVVFVQNKPISEKVVRNEVAPEIENVAFELGIELIDLHPVLIDHPEWFADELHPNAMGATAIAEHLRRLLTTPRDSSLKLNYPTEVKTGSFHGLELMDFQLNGVECKVAKPRITAEGAPWIWRARFWGHEPQFDIAMLELGWHIVYCDVADLFGSPKAVARWDAFYEMTQRIGLNPKPVLEGMSRGGLIIHNWSVANPDKVAGLIADNAVMDFTSWPGGLGTGTGSKKSWTTCLAAYGLADDAQAKAYDQQPVNTISQLAKAKIPLLYLIGLSDTVVPPAENSLKAREDLKDYQGLQVIEKPGMSHHPHSLPNPAPIVDFTLKVCNPNL